MSDPHTDALVYGLGRNLTHGERFHRTLQFACALLTADRGILVPSRTRYPDMPPATYGFTLEEWHTPGFAFSRRLVHKTFQAPIAILTSDAQPDFQHYSVRSLWLHSILCIPILGHEQPHAVLCLQRRLTATPFTSEDLDLLETIALITTQALE